MLNGYPPEYASDRVEFSQLQDFQIFLFHSLRIICLEYLLFIRRLLFLYQFLVQNDGIRIISADISANAVIYQSETSCDGFQIFRRCLIQFYCFLVFLFTSAHRTFSLLILSHSYDTDQFRFVFMQVLAETFRLQVELIGHLSNGTWILFDAVNCILIFE